MSSSRAGVLVTQSVTLRVVFEDSIGDLVTPDASSIQVYIYDEGFTTEDIEAEVDAATFTGLGPFTPTEITTGYYELVYVVPSGSDPGAYHDLWIATLDSVPSHHIFSFEVIDEMDLSIQSLANNELVVVELSRVITDLLGNPLGEDVTITYSTTYSPLYASIDMLRAEVGPWIDFIPNDTLNLLLHWSSKEADMITPSGWSRLYTSVGGEVQVNKGKDNRRYKFARSKFVVYDAAWRSLLLPGASNASNVTGAGQLKRLGDLTIQGPANAGFGSSGLTMSQLNEIKRLRDQWARVVNAGGLIMPGQSLDPSYAIKGFFDPDRRKSGRLWEDPNSTYYAQPTQNDKRVPYGNRIHRFYFNPR